MPGYCVKGTVGHKVLSGMKKIEIDRKLVREREKGRKACYYHIFDYLSTDKYSYFCPVYVLQVCGIINNNY